MTITLTKPPFTHSAKKADSESSNSTKKDTKRKREPSVTSDVEKTPPHSPEEEEDDGVQVNIAEVFTCHLSNNVLIVAIKKVSMLCFYLVVDRLIWFFQWLKPIPKD